VVWDRFLHEIDAQARRDSIGRIQNMIYEKTMFIPLTNTNSPTVVGPRVKGNPYRVQPLLFFTVPFEDIELEQ